MNIAVIGWGSLIWCPRTLQIEPGWHRDSPMLPVEFARKSERRAAHPGDPSRLSEAANVLGNEQMRKASRRDRKPESARGQEVPQRRHSFCGQGRIWSSRRLEERERGAEMVDEDGESRCRYLDRAAGNLRPWLRHQIPEERQRPAQLAKARRYVRMTPPQIQTAVRAAMRKEGWSDCDLPAELFARDA